MGNASSRRRRSESSSTMRSSRASSSGAPTTTSAVGQQSCRCPRCHAHLLVPAGAPIFRCPCGVTLRTDTSAQLPQFLETLTQGMHGGMMRVRCRSCGSEIALPPGVPRNASVLCSCGTPLVIPSLPAALQELLQQRSGGSAAPKGTPSFLIESLPVIEYKNTGKDADNDKAAEKNVEDDESRCCMICLDEYEEGVEQILLPCFHAFHKDCIKEWLEGHKTCPICNGNVSEMMSQSREFATDESS